MKITNHLYKTVLTALTLVLTLTACDKDVINIGSDPFKDEVYKTTLLPPISTYLAEQENFSEYVKVLNYAGLFNALNQSSNGTSFTAFVPDNEAMAEFYKLRGVDSLQQLTKDYARAFVLYHTVKDSIRAEAFVMKSFVENLSNDIIPIEIDTVNAGHATLNGEGKVVEMGVSAFNGKIYVLSRAMTPLVETVYDRIAGAGTSDIMAEAIRRTNWQQRLSTVVDTTLNDERQRVVTHYYYTVLNVTDATFAKEGIGSVDQLVSKLKTADKESLTEDSLLREYVGYHILGNSYTTDNLGVMSGSEVTRLWNTSAKNQVFTVSYDSLAVAEADKYVVNKSSLPARFVPERSNVLSKNGYVHEVDNWMPVWEPEQTTVVWDLADYTEVKNLVPTEDYQPAEPTSAENKYRIALAPCYTYEVGESGTRNSSYHEISYVTCRNNLKDALNHDRVVFNVGYMGMASMRTPVIVKGKYKVELAVVYLVNHNFMRTQTDGNGGMLRMTFDDNPDYQIYTAPYTKVSSALPGVYTSTLYEEIEFPETAAHQLNFVVLDPAASTNSNFSLQFDYIKFTPIED